MQKTQTQQPANKTFRLGQNEYNFLKAILKPTRVSIHSDLPDFIANAAKKDIWERIQDAYNKGSCNI